MVELREHQLQIGRASQNEIINFKLDLYQDEPHVNSIIVELESTNGEMDMFIKECTEAHNCDFTQADIDLYESQKDLTPVRKAQNSQTKEGDDLVTKSKFLLNINCLGYGFVTKKELNISDSFFRSRFCSFVVSLKSATEARKGIPFKLWTQGNEVAHALKLN